MQRREFVIGGVAAWLAVTMLPAAAASGFVDYRPGVIEKALAAGKTVFVDYSAVWCTTCAAQKRVINGLLKENPAYAKAMLFVRVDWDDYGDKPVSVERNIPRRSTLLLLRGDKELVRIVAGTSRAQIKAMLDAGL